MKKAIILSLAVCMLGLAACGTDKPIAQNPTNDASEEYYTQTNLSALEYQMYLANKISVATGQLNTHMSKVQNVASGSCAYEDEIEAIDFSIKTLKDDKRDMTYVYPPDTYSGTREQALKYWQDSIDKLQEIADTLETGKLSTEDAINYSTELKDLFTSIQSLNFTV